MGAALVAGPAQAKAPNLIANYHVLSVTCVPDVQGTVRARVVVRMTVVNYHGVRGLDWAKRMKMSARLIPTTPGLNFGRMWGETKTPDLVQDKRYSYNLSVLTDNVSPTADWQVQVKAVWVRRAPVPDVVKETRRPFNANCTDGSGADGSGNGGFRVGSGQQNAKPGG